MLALRLLCGWPLIKIVGNNGGRKLIMIIISRYILPIKKKIQYDCVLGKHTNDLINRGEFFVK